MNMKALEKLNRKIEKNSEFKQKIKELELKIIRYRKLLDSQVERIEKLIK